MKEPEQACQKNQIFQNELKNLTAFQLLSVLKQNISDGYCMTDEEGFIVDVNEKYCHILEYQENELLGKSFTDLLTVKIRPYAMMHHHEYIWGHADENTAEWTYETKSGGIKLLRSTTTRLLTSKQKPYKLEILSLVEPSNKTSQEDVIKKMQHQFKNTLHEIGGLLHLQAVQLQGEAREAVLFSQMRITAIAIAFELLYKNTQSENIDLADYLPRLTAKFQPAFEIQLEHDAIYWPVDKAYALGIILTEFLNSAKDEQMNGQKLKLVRKRSTLHYHLQILAEDGFHFTLSPLSKQLIHALGKQLQAKVEMQNDAHEVLCLACKL